MRVSGHLVTENLLRRRLVAHKLCLLYAKFHYFEKIGLVVLVVAVVSAVRVKTEHLLPQCPVLGGSHHIVVVGNAGSYLCLIGVALVQKIVSEADDDAGKFAVDLAQPFLRLGIKTDAALYK